MYDFSVTMALVDYIPVIFFGIAAITLLRDLHSRMANGMYAMLAAGTINIFIAGLLKATWKLLYAAGVCDFQALNNLFLPLQSIGFLLAGIGIIGAFGRKSKKNAVPAVVPPVFSGSMVFIMMMVAGLGSICTCLSILAAKMKKGWVIVFFIVAFVASMGMGYMSSRDSTSAIVNWIEQGINCVGQGMLMAGVLILHRSGLKDAE